ncbi:MAG TPA: PSD1 and planctomycete cytochrome C domain-containing protein [Methylomirabilota bacterium]|nr:PSD1 and planctomycete cytochrome C domain-containing protein [Methylomirabilota bacterium]
MFHRLPGWLVLAAMLPAIGPRVTASTDAGDIEFFEARIRPLLATHCYECHSARENTSKGGLTLDTREGVLKGGHSGPVLVPGDPDRSRLVQAVRHLNEDLKMPPESDKLTEPEIADLAAWVRLGAPDPRTGPDTPAIESSNAGSHWAFQPITHPAPPLVRHEDKVRTPVDAFILDRLEANHLEPSPPADRRTLLRRASFDLTGLPPTPAEVLAFEGDSSPDAFARAVDRLLASPRYGERWGRHWLDVARYADTKGYVFEEERRYPYAYTYRDYVIRAFNEDRPFDRFLIEQLAADQLELGDDPSPLAALGFLTLGRRFLNNRHDIIDDRIDVVTRGTMALTVTCARCHDHKYDPVPISDYYSLYGIFASSREPDEQPLLGILPEGHEAYLKERAERRRELDEFRDSKEREARATLRERAGDYLLAAHRGIQLDDRSKVEAMAREQKLDPGVVRRWMNALEDWRKNQHPVFEPWFALADLPPDNYTEAARESLNTLTRPDDARVNPLILKALSENPPAGIEQLAEQYATVFREVTAQWDLIRKLEPAPSTLSDAGAEALRQILFAENAPANPPSGDIPRLFDVPTAQRVRALKRKVDELDATHPGAPPRAMALVDKEEPHDPRVFLRGNPNNPGPEVPRQFLSALSGEDRKPFTQGSGRLELARAIAHPDNPLTARVIVNRVWLHHFGNGLVATPSDFGLRSDPPTHPELLDYLASSFIRNGWSLKSLHREIMLSSTYQQASAHRPEAASIDPANTLLWRMNRLRLELEPMRDALLYTSGSLDLQLGGHAVDIVGGDYRNRRSVYGFVERQNLPGLFRTFDFATPDTTSPARFFTTVPQQALFMMNSPFIIDQARRLADKSTHTATASDAGRVRHLYQRLFQRDPSAGELELGLEFIRQQQHENPPALPAPTWLYGYGAFVEDNASRVDFTPLPHFTGEAWQGGPELPDPKLGWVMLNAEGGHPGTHPNHAAIRRWIVPHTGSVRVSGRLRHDSDQGNGVRARVVSANGGIRGEWIAQNNGLRTGIDPFEVRAGESIDFITDSREDIGFDSFRWTPVIRYVGSSPEHGEMAGREWNAKTDFSGPDPDPRKPLEPWEKYAQVLLISNEMIFVD